MAAIKENVGKDGKIISYRVRACVGRDGAGKQVWRSVTISIEQVEDEALKQGFERLTPARQKKIINRLADVWETAEKEQFLRTPSARDKGRVTVKDFIEKTWIPIYVEDGKKSPNSVKFFKNTSKPIRAVLTVCHLPQHRGAGARRRSVVPDQQNAHFRNAAQHSPDGTALEVHPDRSDRGHDEG